MFSSNVLSHLIILSIFGIGDLKFIKRNLNNISPVTDCHDIKCIFGEYDVAIWTQCHLFSLASNVHFEAELPDRGSGDDCAYPTRRRCLPLSKLSRGIMTHTNIDLITYYRKSSHVAVVHLTMRLMCKGYLWGSIFVIQRRKISWMYSSAGYQAHHIFARLVAILPALSRPLFSLCVRCIVLAWSPRSQACRRRKNQWDSSLLT